MRQITQEAIAGTLESSDVLVKIAPATGLIITINSIVFPQFGEAIRQTAAATLMRLGVQDAHLLIDDKGALDCVLKARIQAAVMRASSDTSLNWEILS